MLAIVVPAVIVLGILAFYLSVVRWAHREGRGEDPRWGMPGEIASYSTAALPAGRAVHVVPTPEGLLLRSDSNREPEWEQLFRWYRVHAEIADDTIRLGGPFGVVLAHPTDGTPLPTALDRMGPRRPPSPFTA